MTSLLPQFRKVTRTAFIDSRDNLHIEDMFVPGDTSHTVLWTMNTGAEPEILSDDEIRLSDNGREMNVMDTIAADSDRSGEIVENIVNIFVSVLEWNIHIDGVYGAIGICKNPS